MVPYAYQPHHEQKCGPNIIFILSIFRHQEQQFKEDLNNVNLLNKMYQVLLKNPIDLVSCMNTYFRVTPTDCSFFLKMDLKFQFIKKYFTKQISCVKLSKVWNAVAARLKYYFQHCPKNIYNLWSNFYTVQWTNIKS